MKLAVMFSLLVPVVLGQKHRWRMKSEHKQQHGQSENDVLPKLASTSTLLWVVTPLKPQWSSTSRAYVQHEVVAKSTMPLTTTLSPRPRVTSTSSPNVHVPSEKQRFYDPFHGLHFGIIPHNKNAARPPVKGSYSVEGTFLWAVGLFGTVENGAVVLTSLCSKRFRKPLHILVGTLAMTDLLISMLYIPSYTYFLLEATAPIESLGGRLDTMEPTRWSFCSVSRSIFVEIASVTLTVKALIALYLYTLASSRELAKTVFSATNTVIYICTAWIINFLLLFIPDFVGFAKVDFYPNAFICNPGATGTVETYADEESTVIYTLSALSIHALELFLICVCFVRVHGAIRQGRHHLKKTGKEDRQTDEHYIRATKTLVLVFITFCLCWLPIYIINIADPSHDRIPSHFHHMAMDLLLLKSAINPAIYIYGIRSLRHEMKVVCMCRCRTIAMGDNPGHSREGSYLSGPSKSNSTRKASM